MLRSSYLVFSDDVVSALLSCRECFPLGQIVNISAWKICGYCQFYFIWYGHFCHSFYMPSFSVFVNQFFLRDLKVIEPIQHTCVQLHISKDTLCHHLWPHWKIWRSKCKYQNKTNSWKAEDDHNDADEGFWDFLISVFDYRETHSETLWI